MKVRILPAVIGADFAHLGSAVEQAEIGGADGIHVDVMDGHFVPYITGGIPLLQALRSVTDLPLDVHLMVDRPENLVTGFADAGADLLTIHVEACRPLHHTLKRIQVRGVKVGVALSPGTPPLMLEEVLDEIDLVLVMTVNPGQKEFIEASLRKITRVRELLDNAGKTEVPIAVDGGINRETAPRVVTAGASWLSAASSVYKDPAGVVKAVRDLREAASRVL